MLGSIVVISCSGSIFLKGVEMKVNWVVDFGAEFTLRKLGIEFKKPQPIKASLVDRKASAENRAREERLDKARVAQIKNAIGTGAPMPALVVRAREDGRYVIAGGNHRFHGAMEADEKEVMAYVIKCVDVEFNTLCKQLNTLEGVGATEKERIKWAAEDFFRENLTQTAAAKRYDVDQSSVSKAVRLMRVETQLAKTGKLSVTMTQAHVLALGEMVSNDNILNAAAELVASGVTAKELKEIAHSAKFCGTEAEQVKKFTDANIVKQELMSKPVKRKIRSEFLAWLNKGESLLCRATSLNNLEILESERAAVESQIRSMVNYLNCL